jgi:hypothetical protein
MRPGWAYCRRRGRNAGVSGVGLMRHQPSEPERERRDIDGHLGRCDLCRIGCRNDNESVKDRVLDKKGASSARRTEASPSPDSVRQSANCGARINPRLDCACVILNQTMNIVVRFPPIYLFYKTVVRSIRRKRYLVVR